MNNNIFDHAKTLQNIKNISQAIRQPALELEGVLIRAIGLTLEGEGFEAPIGTVCKIQSNSGVTVDAVITGFRESKFYLMPTTIVNGLELGSKIITQGKTLTVPVGENLLGRVIDSYGMPLDNKPVLYTNQHKAIIVNPTNPLSRAVIKEPLDVGIRAINGLMTIGKGQRIGLFAGSGVGKSVLLGMIAKFSSADVIVVALIGERGREVKEFIEYNLGVIGLKKTVVVASPADCSPVTRYNGALSAMAIAEYFRDTGKQVLFLMDSLTRFAQAQREIALAMGEPPATKGYPPSVFAMLPQLVERAGMGVSSTGSITGIFTVLAESDDHNDPIVDAARAILDGHIVLARKLADIGHYPAIDVSSSVSRVMPSIVTDDHLQAAKSFKRSYSIYQENKDLINIGAYTAGVNPELDSAVKKINQFNVFLQQGASESVALSNSKNLLCDIIR